MNNAIPQLKSDKREGDDADATSLQNTSTEKSSSQASYGYRWVRHTTRSGYQIGLKRALYDPSNGKTIQFTAIQNYYGALVELENEEVELSNELANLYVKYSNVRAGVGGGFENTLELKPMRYEKAINGPDGMEWRIKIDNEYDRMVKNNVFGAVKRENLPPGTKITDSTWAYKKKETVL